MTLRTSIIVPSPPVSDELFFWERDKMIWFQLSAEFLGKEDTTRLYLQKAEDMENNGMLAEAEQVTELFMTYVIIDNCW